MSFDEFDRKILQVLQKDASLSLDKLSEKIGLSRNACWRRIRIMEENGVIIGRSLVLDPDKVGLGLTMIVHVRTNNHSAEWLERFRQALLDLPEVSTAYRLTGDLDYLLRVHVADAKSYDRFYQRLISRISLSDVSASFVMETIKQTEALPI
jgi:Lrp/AsnC family transcriptional regulator